MTTPASVQPVDFRRPRGLLPPNARLFARWHEQAARLTAESWNAHLAHPVHIRVSPVEATTAADALRHVPDPSWGAVLRVAKSGLPSLLVLPVRQVLALVGDLLGTGETEWPEARSLTEIEEALLEMLLRQLAQALGQAWPHQEAIPCSLERIDARPARSRLFAPQSLMLLTRLTVESRFGKETCQWLLPQEEVLADLFDQQPPPRNAAPAAGRLEALARGIPVEIVVRLGEARLSMSQVAALQEGDVIVLEQPIASPLQAFVAGAAKFVGRPGRIGLRQSFLVDSLLKER